MPKSPPPPSLFSFPRIRDSGSLITQTTFSLAAGNERTSLHNTTCILRVHKYSSEMRTNKQALHGRLSKSPAAGGKGQARLTPLPSPRRETKRERLVPGSMEEEEGGPAGDEGIP